MSRRPAATPRLGFLGLGWIGALRLEAVAAAGAAEAAALCDASPQRLAEVAGAHPGAVSCASFEEMLERAGELALDGVVIATPSGLHAAQTEAALARGLAVFCQKPLTVTAEEARRVVAAARRADRLLGVDYSYRHTDAARALAARLAAGELGRLHTLDAVFHNAYGPDKAWCRDVALAGGGALVDLGVHLVDLALWMLRQGGDGVPGLAPRVTAVHGRALAAGEPLAGRGIDDFATARVELAAGEGPGPGRTASLDVAASWYAHAGRDCAFRVELWGTEGGASFHNVGGSFYDFELVLHHGREREVVSREGGDWLGRALVAWAERLAERPGFDPEVEGSVAVAEVIDRIYGAGGEPEGRTAVAAEPSPPSGAAGGRGPQRAA
ncbi:MAG TPA: Gfo/Idh/MocA family oxidoreductase [Thermoanaerobaculia bacterium]|nr:Gfo/Idh/MocA family oxidoreductase [Thermoanaerobaculia bacterium]